ncbi:hypothetical protein QR680_006323 [Steinernema hermaphroditum]|uniref:EGF-like domain-containing protein n=1 Tax=Steinernema hermaphroditum TaxID=289476 RepID=A0AA39LWC9_9BILA|nr:hypothetical protein QR680_006323 [Steinernema hermaphroditum]
MISRLLLIVSTTALVANETCGQNEQFYPCGPCDSPCGKQLFCPAVCSEDGGCGCLPGHKRNSSGDCIPQERCPTPPCPTNETFYSCGSCDGTCGNPYPPCPLICKLDGSCNCKEGYVRDKEGDCIVLADCPTPMNRTCGVNEQFYPCGACDSPCGVDMACVEGCRPPGECGCLSGYKRDENGLCVPPKECRCGPNEVFDECGPCDGTCRRPHRPCPRICRLDGGCGCRHGYVRNEHGRCIPREWCLLYND